MQCVKKIRVCPTARPVPPTLRKIALVTSLPTPLHRSQYSTTCRGIGGDAVGGWMDLASLVTGGSGKKSAFDELASSLGKDVYIDVSGWHLYLRDLNAVPGLKMSQALAQQLGPQAKDRLREGDVEKLLQRIPVKLGAGKVQLSLFEVMPSACVRDIVQILDDYARK